MKYYDIVYYTGFKKLSNVLKKLIGEKKLIYDLIFGENDVYEIPIMEYIDEIELADLFRNKITTILNISGIKIKEDILVFVKDTKLWTLKIDRKNNRIE